MHNEDYQENILNDKDLSTTLVKEIKCTCHWTIYNFSFFTQGEKIGPSFAPDIESPLFRCGCNDDLIWDLNITNLRDLEDEYFKIYVYINDVEWHNYKNLEAKVSILNDKGKEAHTMKYKPSILSTDVVNFIKKDYLMDKNNRLLNNDNLVIVCEINAFAEVYTHSWNASQSDDENEDKECTTDIFRSKLRVSQDLRSCLQDNLHDSIVVVKKQQFHVHKWILAARSPVFSAMFEREMQEQANNTVIIKDINCKTFEAIIEFIYHGTLNNNDKITSKVLLEILIAADKYELTGLKEICECIFSSKLLTSNAIETLMLADFYHADKLKAFVIQYIVAHKKDFIDNREFESLLNTHAHLIPLFIEEKSEQSIEDSLDETDSDEENFNQNNCINHIHLPPTNSPLEEKQWSVTEIGTDKDSCTWKINQFGLIFNRDTFEYDYIVSDKFSKDNVKTSWYLLLYPKGVDSDSKDYVSLLVQFIDESCLSYKMQAQYEFAILNAKGETVNRKKSDLLTFTTNQSKLGESKFIKRDLLFNKKMNLLQDNALVLLGTVKFGLNSQKRFYQSALLNYCEHKFLLAVSDDLERFLESGKYSDITLIVGGKEFFVHRSVLAARSPSMLNAINELLQKQKKETVKLDNIDEAVFKEVLLFIYSGKVKKLKELAKSIYVEASKFQLKDLKSICESYLCKNLTLENVCDSFVFAHVNNSRKLKSKCSLFITDHLKAVISTAGYKSLAESRPQLLKDLLLERHNL